MVVDAKGRIDNGKLSLIEVFDDRWYKSKNQDEIQYEEGDVLDGQQRLTTLFLLYAVIRDMAGELCPDESHAGQIRETCGGIIHQDQNKLKNIPERQRIVFDIRDDVRDFVERYVIPQGHTGEVEGFLRRLNDTKGSKSVISMAEAIVCMREVLGAAGVDIYDYLCFLNNKVFLIYVATSDINDAFRIFTVLNDRGMRLGNGDILKAKNLRAVSESNRPKYAREWEEMEGYFGDDFERFLSQVRSILVKRRATGTILKEFEDTIYAERGGNPILEPGEQTLECMRKYYEAYAQMFDAKRDETSRQEVWDLLQLMQDGLKSDDWVCAAMDYYARYGEDGFADFLRALERKVSADWICGLSPTRRIDGVHAILRAIESAPSRRDLLGSQALSVDIETLESTISGKVYGRPFDKYLLLKLEYLYHGNTAFVMPRRVTVEHILPQNPSEGSQWTRDFDQEQRDYWTDRIGNLILISRNKNASLSNLDYERKRERYFKSKIETFPNSMRVYQNFGTWTPDDLEANQKEVVGRLMGRYGCGA